MIASRIGQFPSLLKWFQLIRENYGSDIVSLVWSTNSTFDNIMGCVSITSVSNIYKNSLRERGRSGERGGWREKGGGMEREMIG